MNKCFYCDADRVSARLYRYSLDGRLLRVYGVCKNCVSRGESV